MPDAPLNFTIAPDGPPLNFTMQVIESFVPGPAGLGFTLRSGWDVDTEYAINDVVSFDDALYGSLKINTGITPGTDPTTWMLMVNGVSGVVDWSSLTGKPDTFPPTLPIGESGVTDLETDLATLTSAEAADAAAISALQTRLTTDEGAIASIDSELASHATAITALMSNESADAAAIATLQSRVSTDEGNITANGTAISTLQGRATNDEIDIASLKASRTSDEAATATNTGDITSLKASRTTDESDIASLKSSRTTDEATLGTATTDIASLKTSRTADESNIASLQLSRTSDEISIASLLSSRTADEATLATAQSDISGLKTSRTADESNITSLLASRTSDEGNITSLLASRTTDEASIATAQTDISGLKTSRTTDEADIASLKASRTSDEATLATATSDISGLKTSRTADESNITSLLASRTTDEATLSTATTDITSLKSSRTTDEAAIATAQTDITSLKSSRTTDEANISSLQTSRTADEANITSLLASRTTDEAAIAAIPTADGTTIKVVSGKLVGQPPAYSTLTGLPTLGTASPLNVPATGNATSGQIVLGSDTRLLAADGSTIVNSSGTIGVGAIPESKVTNLSTDLGTLTTNVSALQSSQASSSAFGLAKVDGTSITAASGVISAVTEYQFTQASGTMPAWPDSVSLQVKASGTFFAVGGFVLIPGIGQFQISSIPDSTHLSLQNLAMLGNVASGTTIPSGSVILPISAPTYIPGDWTAPRFEDFHQGAFGASTFSTVTSGASAVVGATNTASSGFGNSVRGLAWFGTGTTSTGRANLWDYAALVPGSVGFDIAVRFGTKQLSTSTDTFRALFGFADSANLPSNVIVVEVGAGSNNNIRIASGSYSSPTYTDTSVAMAANAMHSVRLIMNVAWTKLYVYVDGTLTNTITSGLPTSGTFNVWLGVVKTGGSTGTTFQYVAVDCWTDSYHFTGR